MYSIVQAINGVILFLDVVIFLVLYAYLFLYITDSPTDDFDVYHVVRSDDFIYNVESLLNIPRHLLVIFVLIVFLNSILNGIYRYTNGFGTNHYYNNVIKKQNILKWVEFTFNSTLLLFVICLLSGTQTEAAILFILIANICINVMSCCLDIFYPNEFWYWVVVIVQTLLATGAYFVLFANLSIMVDSDRQRGIKTSEAIVISVAGVALLISLINWVQYVAAFYKVDAIIFEIAFNLYSFTIRFILVAALISYFSPNNS